MCWRISYNVFKRVVALPLCLVDIFLCSQPCTQINKNTSCCDPPLPPCLLCCLTNVIYFQFLHWVEVLVALIHVSQCDCTLPDKKKSLHACFQNGERLKGNSMGKMCVRWLWWGWEDTIAEVEEIPTQELRSFGVNLRTKTSMGNSRIFNKYKWHGYFYHIRQSSCWWEIYAGILNCMISPQLWTILLISFLR